MNQQLLRKMLAASLLLAVLLAALPMQGSTFAQQSAGVRMQAIPSFEGYFKYGEWLPIWVELENSGPNLDAELQLRIGGSSGVIVYAAPVSLPTGSHKRVLFYAIPNNYSRELNVQLVAGEKEIAAQQLRVHPQPNITYMVGISAPEWGALGMISGIKLPGQSRPVVLVDVSLDDLPERSEGLRSFDALVLNGVDTSTISPEQRNALELWVRQGGRLILGGGSRARSTLSGLPDVIRPITIQDDDDVTAESLSELAEFAGAGEILASGSFVLSTGDIGQSIVLAGSQEQPLVMERKLGSGAVNFIALNPAASPFEGWSGATAFWEALLSPGGSYPSWLAPDMSERQQRGGQIPYALSNLPMLDLPSVRGLAILLGIYILLVGPANYLFLRWRNRLHWAWITIPVITLLFSVGAFGMGYFLHGSDLLLNRIAVVQLLPDGKANVTSYMGLFSPGTSVYEIEVSGGGLISPTSNYINPWDSRIPAQGSAQMVFLQGDPARLRGLAVDQWSMQSFMVEGMQMDFGQVTAELYIDGNELRGGVENNSAYELKDVVVLLGHNFARLGTLSPGGSAEVSLPLTFNQDMRFAPPRSYMLFEQDFSNPSPDANRRAEVRRMILESLIDQGGKMGPSSDSINQNPLLIAWLDDAPPDVHVQGLPPSDQTTALLYLPLPYDLPASGEVSLPPGVISGNVVQMPEVGGMCGNQFIPSVYIERGEAVFAYVLPFGGKNLEVDTLTLSIWSDGGWWQAPSVAVYNWTEEAWMDVVDPGQGQNVIPNAGPYVNPDGRVHVKLENAQAGVGCFYLGLGVDGRIGGGAASLQGSGKGS